MNKTPSICFVVHKGKLEIQSLLLAASLRFYNQDNYTLYACIPKELGGIENGITENTRSLLAKLNVKFVEISNPIEKKYLIGNKLQCLDTNPHFIRAFLDTDIICCKKLSLPDLQINSIAVKPADRNTCTWTKKNWQKAYLKYADYELQDEDFVISTAFNEKMCPYYNAGVIVINSKNNFSKTWAFISKQLDNDIEFNNKRPWLDQLALPLTIKKMQLNCKTLTEQHNFPANIKPVTKNIELVHYHRPDVIAKNSILINCIKIIAKQYTWLLDVINDVEEWNGVSKLVNMSKTRNYYNPPKTPGRSIIITGIPRSGTSYLCYLLSKVENHIVINEPQEVIRPLKKRYIPWGIGGYYSNIRRDIILGKPILNKQKNGKLVEDTLIDNNREFYHPAYNNNNFSLVTKNTIGYLTALARVLMVLPGAKYIGVFRNPIDTIASWKTSFPHLQEAMPCNINILKLNVTWLDKADKELVSQIETSKTIIVRQALMWNLFARQLIDFRHKLKLVSYSDLVSNPKIIIDILNIDDKFDMLPRSTLKSKSHVLSREEKNTIYNITEQNYFSLLQNKFN